MIIVREKIHYTIADAAKRLGISAKTIRDYIHKGIIAKPPEITYGLRILKHFPLKYLKLARLHIDNSRQTALYSPNSFPDCLG
jgi:predicted site-specific integrase-resolvase